MVIDRRGERESHSRANNPPTDAITAADGETRREIAEDTEEREREREGEGERERERERERGRRREREAPTPSDTR